MTDVKARLAIVEKIIKGLSPLGNEGLDGEIAMYMLRRALEQIAFGSLLGNSAEYSAVHKYLEQSLSAKRLLSKLAKVNEDSYPQPLRLSSKRPLGVAELASL